MSPLMASFRMVEAGAAHHHQDAGKLPTAILTSVFFLFGAFVQLMAPFVASIRMARAGGGGQQTDTGELMPAVFAIEILFFHKICIE